MSSGEKSTTFNNFQLNLNIMFKTALLPIDQSVEK